MQRTTDNYPGIIDILERAQDYDDEIGLYQEHFINERFNYTVLLDNGIIEIPRSMARDIEVQPRSVSKDRIKAVAATFVSNKPKKEKKKVKTVDEPIVEPVPKKKMSWWRKLFFIFSRD